MIFDTIKELEEWMDDSWGDEDHIAGDEWRNFYVIQKVFRNNHP